MPTDLAEHAAAVVREAVSNVIQHAHAGEMTITVSVEDDLAIAVTDDGIGMPTTVARSSLHNLNSRALTCGGTFTVERQPEGGTKVLWSVPLP